ncbi:MAG: hypothetical protein K0S30_639 [Clostridia bacterium]|jgi:hypothetical protein|nr:hypothetical protein [Clostridia bacterium]
MITIKKLGELKSKLLFIFIALCLIDENKKGIFRIKATKHSKGNFIAFMSIYKY